MSSSAGSINFNCNLEAVPCSSLTSPLTQISSMLDSAAEQMMVNVDFQAAFNACERGLQCLSNMDQEDSRCAELKAGFCILAIQALAEMNQWHGVFSWVLQQYEHQERIPAKIMQMCILLYSKVKEPAVMQEAARVWLNCPTNCRVTGFATVAELYLLHVLVPLDYRDEALELIDGDVGSIAFTEEQRQAALEVLEEKAQQIEEPIQNPRISPDSETAANTINTQGSLTHKLESIVRFLYRKLFATASGSFSLQKIFLAAVLLYMLFLRLDPASPSAFMWISKLLQLLKQTWRAMFAPYYQALESKRL